MANVLYTKNILYSLQVQYSIAEMYKCHYLALDITSMEPL